LCVYEQDDIQEPSEIINGHSIEDRLKPFKPYIKLLVVAVGLCFGGGMLSSSVLTITTSCRIDPDQLKHGGYCRARRTLLDCFLSRDFAVWPLETGASPNVSSLLSPPVSGLLAGSPLCLRAVPLSLALDSHPFIKPEGYKAFAFLGAPCHGICFVSKLCMCVSSNVFVPCILQVNWRLYFLCFSLHCFLCNVHGCSCFPPCRFLFALNHMLAIH
jgi:hypothetical protein